MAELIDRFKDVISRPDGKLMSTDAAQTKFCGYWCSYVPEELILACGMTPLRIRGMSAEDSSSGDAWLSSRLCTFSRWALSAALDGQYDFLEGIIGLNSCDQVRRASQIWMEKSPAPFSHFIAVPRATKDINFQAYLKEIKELKVRLEEFTGKAITDDDLGEAVDIMNNKRALLNRISALRKLRGAGHVKGSEMLTISIAATQMPPEEFIELGRVFLDEREEQTVPDTRSRARLVVCGGELDDPRFLEVLEGQGAEVVGEFLCFGSRSYAEPVETGGDLLENIAHRYFYHVPCVRMGEKFHDRYNSLKGMLQEYDGEGLIYQRLTFCQLWGSEYHNMLNACRREGIPLLSLERDYGVISTGQMKTRVQAFLEKLELARA